MVDENSFSTEQEVKFNLDAIALISSFLNNVDNEEDFKNADQLFDAIWDENKGNQKAFTYNLAVAATYLLNQTEMRLKEDPGSSAKEVIQEAAKVVSGWLYENEKDDYS